MSRVYFHSPSGTAELHGSQRARGAGMCRDMLLLSLGLNDPSDGDWIKQANRLVMTLPPNSRWFQRARTPRAGAESAEWAKALVEWIVISDLYDDEDFHLGDQRVSPFTASLNTAWVMGSDPVRLLARIHGQCEIHGWVDGPNRAWLAEIAERGVKTKVLWRDVGWESVIKLLRQRDDEPVVMSYSVTEQFPNGYVAEWKDANDGDDWYELPEEQRWSMAMEKLRAKRQGLEMNPDNWNRFYFSSGLSGFDILNYAMEHSAERV